MCIHCNPHTCVWCGKQVSEDTGIVTKDKAGNLEMFCGADCSANSTMRDHPHLKAQAVELLEALNAVLETPTSLIKVLSDSAAGAPLRISGAQPITLAQYQAFTAEYITRMGGGDDYPEWAT
jgi:ribosomal protein L24E